MATAPDDGIIKIIKQINVDNTQPYDLAAKYNINNEEITATYLRKDTAIPASILPSYVDDVIEGYYLSNKFYKTNSTSGTLINGEAGKIYVDLTTNKTYRYSGSTYIEIAKQIAYSTNSAASHTHTHSVTVNGTTGNNSGSAVKAVTGYGSFSGGSGSLTSDTTSTNGIAYLSDVTHTAASLTGTKTFNTDAIKSVNLSASTSADVGPAYVESVTHTAASLTGTKSFNTDAIKSVSLSASTTSTDGPAYVESVTHTPASLGGTKTFVTGVTTGSGSLEAYDAATSGTKKVSNGTRIPFVTSVTHTPASLTGTKTFVTAQGTFSAGTTPPKSASPTHTSTNSGSSGSGTSVTIASVDADGVLTLASSVNSATAHTHTYDKTTGVSLTAGTAPSLGAASTGTVGISGGSITPVTYYLAHAHTSASSSGTGTVTISGGSITPVTKYMKPTGTAASKATVGISGGSITPVTKYLLTEGVAASTGTVGISGGSVSKTTKYLHHTHDAASLGSPSTSNAAPHTHTHSYGSSTALTTGNNSGSVTVMTPIG